MLNSLKRLLGSAVKTELNGIKGAAEIAYHQHPKPAPSNYVNEHPNLPISLPAVKGVMTSGDTAYAQNPWVVPRSQPVRSISEDGPPIQGGFSGIQTQTPVFPQQMHPLQIQNGYDESPMAMHNFEMQPMQKLHSLLQLLSRAQ